MAFWLEYKTGISKSSGLFPSEIEYAKDSPEFVSEFQGDQYGCEKWGKSDCGRKCGHGHGKEIG